MLAVLQTGCGGSDTDGCRTRARDAIRTLTINDGYMHGLLIQMPTRGLLRAAYPDQR